jgi:hypothetical protein
MNSSQQVNPYGWPDTETLQTRFGAFEFKDGYPVGDAAQRLLDLQKLNRAVESTPQPMPVSEIALREGLRAFGATTPQQVVIWEQLMDARMVLLTANTETVYALAHLNLNADGPTVVEAPPHMLGFLQDGLQRYSCPAARRHGDSSCRLFCLQVPNIFGHAWIAGLPGGRQDRSGGRADEADQDISARQRSSIRTVRLL